MRQKINHTSEEIVCMEATALDMLWLAPILLCNVAYFWRKAVLLRHGYAFSPFDLLFQDAVRMASVIDSLPQGRKRRMLMVLNRSVGWLFWLGALTLLFTRGLPGFVHKLREVM
jgi:hypothetical protein